MSSCSPILLSLSLHLIWNPNRTFSTCGEGVGGQYLPFTMANESDCTNCRNFADILAITVKQLPEHAVKWHIQLNNITNHKQGVHFSSLLCHDIGCWTVDISVRMKISDSDYIQNWVATVEMYHDLSTVGHKMMLRISYACQ